ncbi:SRPBCC family protein [Sphingosinicella sp. BN140058]|uniref:SRPBCC family protein n=1 Tax=Sphingosinicella sp. BN140058 TaxID=1892855 RepID=UPI001012E786|nr:SRPBCC family protein [Sphingosinicella sp. BN140058]QAY76157.1 ATPase [Sphingosinicella sp. BN140058]
MTHRSAAHTSFVLERRFTASPARVFRAWSDPVAKQRWSDCHAEVGTIEYSMDFRPGGREIHRAMLPTGALQRIEKVFLEIVPDARIIFAYAMEAGGRSLSASLVTTEFVGDGGGTLLRLTEQLAYLDGHDDLEERMRGTAEGLDRLLLEVEDLPTA